MAPGLVPEVIEFALKKSMPILPGCVTASDISIAFDEAGNRLTAMRGILVYLMKDRAYHSPLEIAAARESLSDFLGNEVVFDE